MSCRPGRIHQPVHSTQLLAVAVRAAIERGGTAPGDVVVVIGPGTIGLLVAQVAMAGGATATVAGLRQKGPLPACSWSSASCMARRSRDVPGELVAVAVGSVTAGVLTSSSERSGVPGFDRCRPAPLFPAEGRRLIAVAFTGVVACLSTSTTSWATELALVTSRG